MANRSGRRHLDARLRRLQEARQRYQNEDIHDPHLRFYTAYDREAKVFDNEYVWACRENLSEVLVVAGLFSAACASFALDISYRIGRDTTAETADLLRVILYVADPTSSEEKPTVPDVWNGPSSTALIASNLVYSSWLLSMLTSFLAMLAKQWLDRYIQRPDMSVTARCRDRQRKCDAIDQWQFQLFIDALPLLLQVALLLLASGLSMYMATNGVYSSEVVIIFTVLGAGIYIVFIIFGAVSSDSPFQTPASAAIRTLFGNILLFFPALEKMFIRGRKDLSRLVQFGRLPRLLPVSIKDLRNRWTGSLEVDLYVGSLRSTNADDAHCISWVLKSIADREAIDAALQLAGTVQWFEAGCNSNPPYDLIVTIFRSCFDHTKSLDPKMRDRAYFSATAILQIYTSALREPGKDVSNYCVPVVRRIDTSHIDNEFKSVLGILDSIRQEYFPPSLLSDITPRHALWISGLLLRFVLNESADIVTRSALIHHPDALHYSQWHEFPSRAVKDFILVWCVHLKSKELGREMLRDKETFHSLEDILDPLFTAVLDAIRPSDPHHPSLPYLLNGLAKWKGRPPCLAHMAYAWCTRVCGEIENDDQCAHLVYLALQVGFRHLPPALVRFDIRTNHAHADHQRMVDLVFRCEDYETIADALCAWTSLEDGDQRPSLLGLCAKRLVKLADRDVEFPPRLRLVVIRAVNLIGLQDFEWAGMEALVGLLNRLEVSIDDIRNTTDGWVSLLRVIASEVGRELLSLQYWELLVQLVGSLPDESKSMLWDAGVIASLEANGQWERLIFWLGSLWISRPPEGDSSPTDEIIRATAALFEQDPTAVQKLEGWVRRSGGASLGRVYADEFQRICNTEDCGKRSTSHLPLASVGSPSVSQTPETTPTPVPSPSPSPAPSPAPSQVSPRPPSSPPVQSPAPSDGISFIESRDSHYISSPVQSQSSSPAPSLDIGDLTEAVAEAF